MKTHPIETPTQPTIASPQRWLISAVQLWGLILLTLHLAADNLPEETTWSLWPYTFLPLWLGWTLALLAGTLIMPIISNWVMARLRFTFYVLRSTFNSPTWFALIVLLSGLIFWLARLRHLRWGDAYMLSKALTTPDLELRVIYNWQAPLTVFLHQRLWQFVADPLLGWLIEYVYAAVSIICGMIFVYLTLTFAAQLGRPGWKDSWPG
jgi:hypothetical protein